MSINSKARRDAGKRRLAKLRSATTTASAPSIEAHAELRDGQGRLLGGIVRRDGEWTLGLNGKIVGGSDSAARVLAMLKRAATLHEREGVAIRMVCSPSLSTAAARELACRGLSFEQFQAQLEMDLASGAAHPLDAHADDSQARH